MGWAINLLLLFKICCGFVIRRGSFCRPRRPIFGSFYGFLPGEPYLFKIISFFFKIYFNDISTACRSEEHTSELQSLMRISYAVFCLKKQMHTSSVVIKLATAET